MKQWESIGVRTARNGGGRLLLFILFIILQVMVITVPMSNAQTQAAAANLRGKITDEQGAVIEGATVTVKNEARNVERTAQTLGDGSYRILAIPPGNYQVTVESQGFARAVYQDIVLSLGQDGVLNAAMRVTAIGEEVIVTADVELTDRTKTQESFNIDQNRIDNLPIDGRNFLNFALTSSQISRDSSAPIGPAPTTGLVFGGQRPRSNLVQVDGADNIDSSVNASRSTLSQEAVQEFQVLVNGFAPEFGRTLGGVVNIVTRSGSDEFHGSGFGFIRHKDIQARNPLAFTPDGKKPAFTRGQYGFTFSGPLRRGHTFFFASIEQNRRQESGFSVIGLDKSIFDLTPAQQAFIAANPGLTGLTYKQIATSGASVAQTGVDINTGLPFFFPAFFTTNGRFGRVPATFRTFNSVENVFPITNKFTFYSIKIDHVVNAKNRLSLRYGFTPSTTTGIPEGTTANDRSRTSIVEQRDTAFVAQDTHIFSSNMVNELLFQFARRGAAFTADETPAFNIGSVALFGRSALAPIDRVERRYELKDNFSLSRGAHNSKFGFDVNYISGRGSFQLAFSGLYQFGDIPASAFPVPGFANAPPFTPVQSYGLGIPQTFVQGFGEPTSELLNRTFGFYGQDSWRVRPNLTFNYGLRYDIELTQLSAPPGLSSPTLTLTTEQLLRAQRKLGIVEGLPRDRNNVAPRFGLSWDVRGNGDTLIRTAYGVFFDHPPLFVGFNSTVIDGVRVPQFVSIAGTPDPNSPLNATQIFSGTVVPGTTPGVAPNLIYLPDQVRFAPNSFPGYGLILPSIISIARNFTFSYSHQANLSIEKKITNDMSFTATYTFTGGRSLPRPRNINPPNAKLLLQLSPTGFPTPEAIAANFFRPSGPSPVFVKTDLPIPYGAINLTESAGSSVYHALTVELRKRFSRNYQVFTSYTYSKVLDDSIDITNLQTAQDNNNPGLERSPSVLDQRHRFVVSGVVTSPFMQSDSVLWHRLLSNFTLSSIVELSAGRPFNILTGSDTNLDQQSGTDRPNVDSQGNLTLPALGEIGNIGRNVGVAPGFASVNLRVARAVPIRESLRLELIAEAFNLFNRVNIDRVTSDFRTVKFRDGRFRSQPTSAFDPRQFQFALRLSF
jgi:hypothetical protein